MYRAVIDGEDHYVRDRKRYDPDRRPQSVKFLKIDIEGVDYDCLKAILQGSLHIDKLPQYISFESFDVNEIVQAAHMVHTHGYTHFKLVEQSRYHQVVSSK